MNVLSSGWADDVMLYFLFFGCCEPIGCVSMINISYTQIKEFNTFAGTYNVS